VVDVRRSFLVLAPLVAVLVRGKRHGTQDQVRGAGFSVGQFAQVHGRFAGVRQFLLQLSAAQS